VPGMDLSSEYLRLHPRAGPVWQHCRLAQVLPRSLHVCTTRSFEIATLIYGYRHLKPGGWLEQLEMSIEFRSDDGTVTHDHVLAVWSRIFIEAGEKFGKTFRIADLARGYIEDAGFEHVVERKLKLPVGAWSSDPKYKELGQWNFVHCDKGIEGWAMALLTRVMAVCNIDLPPLLSARLIKSTTSGDMTRSRRFWVG
jgi:hypothetical protein